MKAFTVFGFRIILLCFMIFIWVLMYWAHKSDYDENYGCFINAMLISIASSVVVVIGWIWKKEFVLRNKIVGVMFLIFASPLSILFFVYLYQFFIGQYFKV